MRNLLQLRRSELLVNPSQVPGLPLTAFTWDPMADSLICAFGPTESEAFIEIKKFTKQNDSTDIASWDVPCPLPTLKCDKVLNVHYFPDTDAICIVFAGGNIVLVQTDNSIENQIEIVGSVDEGITAASWSPDEEVLAITTAVSTFLLMTRSFELIAEKRFTLDDLQASRHVSVGWGKKETQFEGKRAKAMKDPTVPDKVDEGILSPYDNGFVYISWRGDGAYVSISTVEEMGDRKRRLIRIYNREGNLDSVSEPVDRLEGLVSWRPSGNLITSIQRHPDQLEVVFFERNGLRHGGFNLRLSPAEAAEERVYQIAWNADSSVLAICMRRKVQLWTMRNYHWYLKQDIPHDFDGCMQYPQDAPSVEWHQEKALKVAVALKDRVVQYDFLSAIARGSTNPPNDYGMVTVIDGTTLKLTPLRIANVPPPYALHEVIVPSAPVDVASCPNDSLIAVLRYTGIDIIRYHLDKPIVARKPELVASVSKFPADRSVRQICFVTQDVVAVLSHATGRSQVNYIKIVHDRAQSIAQMVEDFQITKILPGFYENQIFYVVEEERIISYSPTEGSSEMAKLPVPCPNIEIAKIGGKALYFGLTDGGKLFANHQLVAPNVTSFATTGAHLIYTTSQHFLKFAHLKADCEELEVPPDDPTGDERCRSIERGARIVSVTPSNFAVTLQMPRGNLETIYPRALVLSGVRQNVHAKDYKSAFLACRSHKVDFNILYDYNPEQFLANIGLFIEQVKKTDYIDLFLSQLKEEDVTQTMYRESLKKPGESEVMKKETKAGLKKSSKINRICAAFVKELYPSRLATNLQNIITAYACNTPSDLESSLKLIGELRQDDVELAEQALIHICFLADVNKLYDSALGLYDLELTLMVAQQSQKDPREYLPFLQSLQEILPLARRKFNIDDHLRRFARALEDLHGLGDEHFEEFKNYTIKHNLYQLALKLHRFNKPRQTELMRVYARHLDEQSRFKEAGLAYESVSAYRSAVEAYRRAGLWRHAMSTAKLADYAASEMQELSQNLAEALVESKKYEEAATIYRDYLSNISEACSVLCKGFLFSEAIRLIGLSNSQNLADLFESVIDPGLLESFNFTLEMLSDCKQQGQLQYSRLLELRNKRESDPFGYFDTGIAAPDGANIPDHISVAATDASTSGGTFLTRYTGKTGDTAVTGASRRTSKNRRREERKRARGKRGTIYEEEYLLNSIARLVERMESTKSEASRLVEGLVRRGMRERGEVVCERMEEVLNIMQEVIEGVFEDEVAVRLFLYGTGEGAERGVEQDGGKKLQETAKKIPVVGEFEMHSLL